MKCTRTAHHPQTGTLRAGYLTHPVNKSLSTTIRNARRWVFLIDIGSEGKTFKVFGKMRAQSHSNGKAYYRCRAHEMGYPKCQGAVRADSVDDQVLTVLMGLMPPKGWRSDITTSVGELLGEKNLNQRLAEINQTIRRMDTRWDNGFFVDEQEYFTQRLKLQGEMEELMPVEKDDLEDAADLLINFGAHYQDCGGDVEAQHELVKRIVERVYIKDKEVKAMTLQSNYHLVMGHNVNGPTAYTADPFLSEDPDDITGYASGDDGSWFATCTVALSFVPSHFARIHRAFNATSN